MSRFHSQYEYFLYLVERQVISMEIRCMRTFLMVADLGSFSKAADVLGYTQSAVTVQIRQLEQELGLPLFDRNGKCVTLTDVGRSFYYGTMQIVNEMDELIDSTLSSKELCGELRIGTVESVCSSILPTVLTSFSKTYPKVRVSVEIGSPGELLDQLDKNLFDAVYLLDQRIYGSKWTTILAKPEEVIFVASPNHPLARQQRITLDEVIACPVMLTEANVSYRRALENYLAAEGKDIRTHLSSASTDLILKVLCLGGGVSFLPEFIVRNMVTCGSLKVLNITDFHFRIWRQILCSSRRHISREMQAFFDIAAPEWKNLLTNKTYE